MMNSPRSSIPLRCKRLCLETGGNDDLGNNGQVALVRPGAAIVSMYSGRLKGEEAGSTSKEPAHGGPLDTFRFLLEWLRDPVGTAAVAPSGKALVSLITHGIGEQTGAVLELGPGTGVFTQGLLARGVAECDLTLVEQNQTFARLLEQRFPRATVLNIDAAHLNQFQEAGSDAFGAAVCGLGLRNMDPRQVEAIMRAAFARMKPEAALYIFTYGRRCSVPDDVLDRLGLVAEHAGTTLRNVPPASVYRIACRPTAS